MIAEGPIPEQDRAHPWIRIRTGWEFAFNFGFTTESNGYKRGAVFGSTFTIEAGDNWTFLREESLPEWMRKNYNRYGGMRPQTNGFVTKQSIWQQFDSYHKQIWNHFNFARADTGYSSINFVRIGGGGLDSAPSLIFATGEQIVRILNASEYSTSNQRRTILDARIYDTKGNKVTPRKQDYLPPTQKREEKGKIEEKCCFTENDRRMLKLLVETQGSLYFPGKFKNK